MHKIYGCTVVTVGQWIVIKMLASALVVMGSFIIVAPVATGIPLLPSSLNGSEVRSSGDHCHHHWMVLGLEVQMVATLIESHRCWGLKNIETVTIIAAGGSGGRITGSSGGGGSTSLSPLSWLLGWLMWFSGRLWKIWQMLTYCKLLLSMEPANDSRWQGWGCCCHQQGWYIHSCCCQCGGWCLPAGLWLQKNLESCECCDYKSQHPNLFQVQFPSMWWPQQVIHSCQQSQQTSHIQACNMYIGKLTVFQWCQLVDFVSRCWTKSAIPPQNEGDCWGSKGINPDDAVTCGAAIWGGILSGE